MGYFSNELLILVGNNLTFDSIFVKNESVNIEVEFLPLYIKILPLILFFSAFFIVYFIMSLD